MNFLNDRKLARRLKAGEVSTRERFYYLLTFALISQFMLSSFLANMIFDASAYDGWTIATDLVYLVSALLGLTLIYNTNRRGDNKEFIERFMCIGLPVTIQLLSIFFLIYGVWNLYPFVTSYIFPEKASLFALSVFYNAYFYLRVDRGVRIASH